MSEENAGGDKPGPAAGESAVRNPAVIPALVCAVLSVALNRIPYMGLFFLVPLGAAALCYGKKTVWAALGAAVLGNTLFAFIIGNWGGLEWDWTNILYFSLIAALFVWIVSPPAADAAPLRKTPYRVVAASLLWAAVTCILVGREGKGGVFYAVVKSQAEFFSSLYTAAPGAGANVVEQAVREHYLTPETLTDLIIGVTRRGGALVSGAVLFAVSIQGAAMVNFFLRRVRPGSRLAEFFVRPEIIWVLSLSLAGIVLFRRLNVELLEVAAWNILAACVILYLTQGIGIISFFLTRTAFPPGVRFAINILIVFMIFSPVFNMVLLGIIVILGIVENWAPLRASRINGPSSTPGNGD